MQTDFKDCPQCHGQLTELDYYGRRLIGCIECNQWGWPDERRLFMEMLDDDIEALREHVRRAKRAG